VIVDVGRVRANVSGSRRRKVVGLGGWPVVGLAGVAGGGLLVGGEALVAVAGCGGLWFLRLSEDASLGSRLEFYGWLDGCSRWWRLGWGRSLRRCRVVVSVVMVAG
jgi:hypothetical protein